MVRQGPPPSPSISSSARSLLMLSRPNQIKWMNGYHHWYFSRWFSSIDKLFLEQSCVCVKREREKINRFFYYLRNLTVSIWTMIIDDQRAEEKKYFRFDRFSSLFTHHRKNRDSRRERGRETVKRNHSKQKVINWLRKKKHSIKLRRDSYEGEKLKHQ